MMIECLGFTGSASSPRACIPPLLQSLAALFSLAEFPPRRAAETQASAAASDFGSLKVMISVRAGISPASPAASLLTGYTLNMFRSARHASVAPSKPSGSLAHLVTSTRSGICSVLGFGFRVLGLGFGVWGFRSGICSVWGLGFGV
jgi:hypothetical protein